MRVLAVGHNWPGHVRELEKLVECVRGLREHASANLYDLMIGLVEKPLLRAVLRETGGNQVDTPESVNRIERNQRSRSAGTGDQDGPEPAGS
ncbi:MAG: hypothetical protein HYU26_08240 [Candidatus Rokubacteria bacterium]|nr:hypothetical protein [Candidatus Rokubacteria bacterium]